jgi:type I restriction enzyme S subunit
MDDGVPLVSVGNVTNGRINLERCHYLAEDTVERTWSRFRLQEGDLVISTSASVGVAAVVGPEAEGAVPYTGVIRLRAADDQMCAGFIRHFVSSAPFMDQVDSVRTGVAIQHYGPSHLRRIVIPVPPRPEQDRIAATLDATTKELDRLVALAKAAIARLAEYRSALITAAVTGQIDVRTYRRDPEEVLEAS